MKYLLTFIMALAILLPASANAASVMEKRASILRMADETLAKLYAQQPATRDEIQNAAGYAVFTNAGLALFYIGGGYGYGVAHSNQNGSDTYMQMAQAGLGLGLGVKDFNTVFVFKDAKAFREFTTNGLDLSGHADAAAKVGDKGGSFTGAADVMPGVRMYQITNSGLMAQAMVKGGKYWVDTELNREGGPVRLRDPYNE